MTNRTQNKQKAPHKKSRGGTLVGVFLGLLLGLLCAFGVVWYLHKSPLPFLDKASRPERNETRGATEPSQPQSAPLSLPGKPGDKSLGGSGEKPRFEFYKILPGGQEATPRQGQGQVDGRPATAPARDQATPGVAPAAENAPSPAAESFYLQAGAFQKSADADNLKAKLALMGLETSVLEANVPEKGVMYRVRVGPFAKPEEMNRARNQLAQTGIQASIVKVKDKTAPQ